MKTIILRILLLTTFVFCILYFNSCKDKCSGVNRNLGTQDMAPWDKALYFSYSPFDTINLLFNGIDTLTFKGGDIISQYDQRDDVFIGNECQTYYMTQNLTQTFTGTGGTIQIHGAVNQGIYCCPYSWNYTFTFNQNYFNVGGYATTFNFPNTDTLSFNGIKYKNVTCTYTNAFNNLFSDSIYYCYSYGIVRIKNKDGIYNRIPKH